MRERERLSARQLGGCHWRVAFAATVVAVVVFGRWVEAVTKCLRGGCQIRAVAVGLRSVVG